MSDQRTRREFLAAAAIGAGAALPVVFAGQGAAQASQPEPSAPAGTPPRSDKGPQQLSAAAAPVNDSQPPTTFANINKASWETILADNRLEYAPPLTIHLPIHPAHSRDFLHVDPALNVVRRRVYPGVSSRDRASYLTARKQELFLVQFALGNPPFVPDFRLNRFSLEEGKYPLARASYFAWDLAYDFEYFCSPVDDMQSLLWVRVGVTNRGDKAEPAHVRVKVNFQRECDIFDDTFDETYTSFYWDQTKWRPCSIVSLKDGTLLRESVPFGKIVPHDWTAAWEESFACTDKAYNQKYGYDRPYFVPPVMRLKNLQDVVHFSTELKPGERRTFAVALLTNYESPTPADHALLARAEPEHDHGDVLQRFRSQCAGSHTRLVFPIDNLDKIFAALQLSTLQCLVQFPGAKNLMPSQGGSLDRHMVWVWEAMYMLLPMLRLGHFKPVRQAIDFIFSLQDGGSPPEGKLTTVAGAVGTTGPRWLNSTGSALALAADYSLYSRDEEFLSEYMPKIVKAMGWIVGEIRATRKLNADGSRPPCYGLMPFGRGNDGDTGYVVTFTDSFTFWGLEKAVTLLERRGHPQATEFRRELEAYRGDLDKAIETMTRPDGYIERQILIGDQPHNYKPFEVICGASNLACTGSLDIHSERFRRFLAYFEEKMMDGFFCGRMNEEVVYMGVGEFTWHGTYLRLGEWKKAFAAMRTNLRYGITPDAFQVQERFSRRNPTFTPWQPNASGNGRILEMMLNCLYFEHDGMATLLGGVPFRWLKQNGATSLSDVYTTRGKVSLDARMLDHDRCRLMVTASAGDVLPRKIRLPEHFEISDIPPQLTRETGGVFSLAPDVREFSVTLQQSPR